jgi:hypothetical protein
VHSGFFSKLRSLDGVPVSTLVTADLSDKILYIELIANDWVLFSAFRHELVAKPRKFPSDSDFLDPRYSRDWVQLYPRQERYFPSDFEYANWDLNFSRLESRRAEHDIIWLEPGQGTQIESVRRTPPMNDSTCEPGKGTIRFSTAPNRVNYQYPQKGFLSRYALNDRTIDLFIDRSNMKAEISFHDGRHVDLVFDTSQTPNAEPHMAVLTWDEHSIDLIFDLELVSRVDIPQLGKHEAPPREQPRVK